MYLLSELLVYKVRDAEWTGLSEWAIGLERAPLIRLWAAHIQVAPSLNQWLTPRPYLFLSTAVTLWLYAYKYISLTRYRPIYCSCIMVSDFFVFRSEQSPCGQKISPVLAVISSAFHRAPSTKQRLLLRLPTIIIIPVRRRYHHRHQGLSQDDSHATVLCADHPRTPACRLQPERVIIRLKRLGDEEQTAHHGERTRQSAEQYPPTVLHLPPRQPLSCLRRSGGEEETNHRHGTRGFRRAQTPANCLL